MWVLRPQQSVRKSWAVEFNSRLLGWHTHRCRCKSPLDLSSSQHTNNAPWVPKCWSCRFRDQVGGLLAAFYLKAGVQLPRNPSTLKQSAVLRPGKDSARLMVVIRRGRPRGGD